MAVLKSYKVKACIPLPGFETFELKRNERKRGRTVWRKTVEQFNDLVGMLFVGPKFDKFGRLIGAERWLRVPTAAEKRIIQRMVDFSMEPVVRNISSKERFLMRNNNADIEEELILNSKWDSFAAKHERNGNYVFVHPAVEIGALKSGIGAKDKIAKIFAGHGIEAPKHVLHGLNSQGRIVDNLEKELEYWKKLIKRKQKKKPHLSSLTIHRNIGNLDKCETVVRLEGSDVVRETVGETFYPKKEAFRIRIVLTEDGILFCSEEIDGRKMWRNRF